MEVLHNTKTLLSTKLIVNNQEKDDQQKTNQQQQPNQSTTFHNNSTSFSDLKYLHKKFKRIASATTNQVIENNNLSSSSSPSSTINPHHHHHQQQPLLNGILTSDLNNSLPKIEPQQQHHINDLINRTTPSPSSKNLFNNSKTGTNHFNLISSHSSYDDKNDLLLLQQTSHKLSLPPLPNNLTLSSNISPINFIENNLKIVNNHHSHTNKSASFNNNNNNCVTINSTTNPSANNIISATNTIYVSSSNGGTNLYDTSNFDVNSTENGQTAATTTLSSSGSSQKAISTIAQEQTSTSGRHVCPYCQLNCSKPSVLQKHIRAHTNERPYPCVPCGFAFKTKSNLYKHER